MTPDKTPPTDSELDAVLTEVVGSDDLHEHWLREIGRPVARAVLAKWGSPVVAGEPVAWRHRMGPTDCWMDCSKEFHDWVLREPEAWKGNEVQALCLATRSPPRRRPGRWMTRR